MSFAHVSKWILGLSRASKAGLIVLMAIASMGGSCPGPMDLPAPKAGSWLVFLCKASDNAVEPHPSSFYQELFANNQRDLLFDFFQQASGNTEDVSGTEVFGWFDMSVNTATLAMRNNSTSPNRSQTLQDCKSAGAAALLAQNKRIDPDKYVGLITVINVGVDVGAAGRGLIANASETASFYEHEMLHVYGLVKKGNALAHSSIMSADLSTDHTWNSGTDKTYFDCWDIMSFATCAFMFSTPTHDLSGPALQTVYRNTLGWLPANRITRVSSIDFQPTTLTLAPVSEADQPGTLLALLDMQSVGTYAVEYRVPTGFDQAAPTRAVVIRELRSNGATYLVTRQSNRIDFTQGDVFTDLAHYVSITVDTIALHSATITIRTHVSSPVGAGEICGDKYVGEVRQCPAGLSCKVKRSGQIQTIDYFCL
jgi:hypothetical protein